MAGPEGEPDRTESPSVEQTKTGEEEPKERKTSVTKVTAMSSHQKEQQQQQDQEEMAALGDLPNEIQDMLKVSKMMETRFC